MSNNKGLFSNLKWKFAERFTAQLVTTIVSIVLARILEPNDYGVIAIVMVFITIANVFVSDGLGVALIQKKNADLLDYSSVLYFNILFSIILYLILFMAAPYISSFYGKGYEVLTPILRVLGLRLILSAVNSIQNAYVAKKMIFRKFFWATLIGTVISAFVGLIMAYLGCGVWALVGQYLTNTTVSTIALAISLNKLPVFKFSIERIKGLLGYGLRVLCTSLLVNLFESIRSLLIGKVYSSSDLAFYDKGQQFPKLIVININTSIASVLFPKMSNEQDNIIALKDTMRNSIRFSAFFMCPMMLGLAAMANTFVSVVLTDKWLPCVPLVQLFCIFYLFQPIHTANIQAIKAVGRSDIYLKLEIFKKTIEIITLVIVINIDLFAMIVSMAVLATLFAGVNAFPNKKLLNYSITEQIKDIYMPIVMSLVMVVIVVSIPLLISNKYLLLVVQILVGVGIYLGLSIVTHNKEMAFVINKVKKVRSGTKNT